MEYFYNVLFPLAAVTMKKKELKEYIQHEDE